MAERANRATAASPTARPAAKRGWLDTRAWRDIRFAARLVREQGVSLVVHGVPVSPVVEVPHRWGQEQPGSEQRATAASASPHAAEPRASQESRLSKRQQRSAARLAEYKCKKHTAQRSVALKRWQGLFQVVRRRARAEHRNAVWTAWMREEVERAPMLTPMEVGGRTKRVAAESPQESAKAAKPLGREDVQTLMELKELNENVKWPSGESAGDCPPTTSLDDWLGVPAGTSEAAALTALEEIERRRTARGKR